MASRTAYHAADPLSRARTGSLARTGASFAMLAWETQMVMAMRMLGMAGLWSVLPAENARMVSEKAPAFAEATRAAAVAAMAGRRPEEVASAWVRPLRRRTSANARRLTRRGPRIG